jgi:hypothetical protein
MKKYIYYLIFYTTLSFGQQNTSPNLVSSAGASLEGWGITSLKMDFSIGEIIIDTGFSDNFIITQGFHQETIYLSTLIESINIDLTIFPNPTSSSINIDINDVANLPIQLGIYDASGKQWGITKFIDEQTNHISLEGLAEGIYFLFLENQNFKNIYKIHKIK